MKEENTNPSFPIPKEDTKSLIESFLSHSSKLCLVDKQNLYNRIILTQDYDKKTLCFEAEDIEKVLERKDDTGESFLQINFKSGKKVILTQEFIGFAPAACVGIAIHKLPKVVTTADLLSVIDAIESFVYGTDQYQESLNDIKLFFESIASGAEAVGFDLTGERLWVERLVPKSLLA